MKFDLNYTNKSVLKIGCVFINGDNNHKYLVSSHHECIIVTNLDTSISIQYKDLESVKNKFNIAKIIEPENLKLVEIAPEEKNSIKLHNYEENGKIYVLGSVVIDEVFTCKYCGVNMERVTPYEEWTLYECKNCGRKHEVFDPNFNK